MRLKNTFKLFKIFGISIEIHFTWLIVFALVTFSLIKYELPLRYRTLSQAVLVFDGVFTSLLFFFSVLAHEMSHSLTARKAGIKIRRITLFIFGGVAEILSEPENPKDELKIALAGPLMSFLLALLYFILSSVFTLLRLPSGFAAPFEILWVINLTLGAFNLIPGFPLDGGRVLRAFIWYRTKNILKATSIASNGGRLLALALFLYGGFVTWEGDISGSWLIFLGLFLDRIAVESYKQAKIQSRLNEVLLEELPLFPIPVIPSDTTAEEAYLEYLYPRRFRFVGVSEGEQLAGLVYAKDIEKTSRDSWPDVKISELQRPLKKKSFIDGTATGLEAFNRMNADRKPFLMVLSGGRLLGAVSQADLIKLTVNS